MHPECASQREQPELAAGSQREQPELAAGSQREQPELAAVAAGAVQLV